MQHCVFACDTAEAAGTLALAEAPAKDAETKSTDCLHAAPLWLCSLYSHGVRKYSVRNDTHGPSVLVIVDCRTVWYWHCQAGLLAQPSAAQPNPTPHAAQILRRPEDGFSALQSLSALIIERQCIEPSKAQITHLMRPS